MALATAGASTAAPTSTDALASTTPTSRPPRFASTGSSPPPQTRQCSNGDQPTDVGKPFDTTSYELPSRPCARPRRSTTLPWRRKMSPAARTAASRFHSGTRQLKTGPPFAVGVTALQHTASSCRAANTATQHCAPRHTLKTHPVRCKPRPHELDQGKGALRTRSHPRSEREAGLPILSPLRVGRGFTRPSRASRSSTSARTTTSG